MLLLLQSYEVRITLAAVTIDAMLHFTAVAGASDPSYEVRVPIKATAIPLLSLLLLLISHEVCSHTVWPNILCDSSGSRGNSSTSCTSYHGDAHLK